MSELQASLCEHQHGVPGKVAGEAKSQAASLRPQEPELLKLINYPIGQPGEETASTYPKKSQLELSLGTLPPTHSCELHVTFPPAEPV